jgi:hypothetical protein
MRKFQHIAAFITLSLLLTGCTQSRLERQLAQGKYWKRTDVREVTYINGVQAQRLLNQDISTCITEIKQEERMRLLREAIPANIHGTQDQYPEGTFEDELALNSWDTPERDRALRAEHYPYHNFESCMLDKGWTRTAFVAYDTVERAHKAYLKNVGYETNEDAISDKRTARRASMNKHADNYEEMND